MKRIYFKFKRNTSIIDHLFYPEYEFVDSQHISVGHINSLTRARAYFSFSMITASQMFPVTSALFSIERRGLIKL